MSTRNLGLLGEQIASRFLENLGYKIIERNFSSKLGEIDIVALDGDILVFVEVKARWSDNFGLPEEAITPQKIRKIIKTAQYYKLKHPQLPESLRIDAIALDIVLNGETKDIRHYKNISQ